MLTHHPALVVLLCWAMIIIGLLCFVLVPRRPPKLTRRQIKTATFAARYGTRKHLKLTVIWALGLITACVASACATGPSYQTYGSSANMITELELRPADERGATTLDAALRRTRPEMLRPRGDAAPRVFLGSQPMGGVEVLATISTAAVRRVERFAIPPAGYVGKGPLLVVTLR